MKKYIIIGVLTSLILWSCNDPEREQAEAYFENLEDWMDEMEEDTNSMTILNWQKIEAEYNEAKAKVDSTQDKLSAESKEAYQELQEEYVDLQMKYKAAIDNTQIEANANMAKIEEWMKSRADDMEDNSEEAQAEIEEEWEEFKNDFAKTADQLTDETKEKWNTLENRVNQWIEYDLKQNLK